MKLRWIVAAAVVPVALATACGEDVAGAPATGAEATGTPTASAPASPGETSPASTPSPSQEPTDVDDTNAQEELTGTLGGDAELEGGCAWLEVASGERYEIFWPESYMIDRTTFELTGPDGDVVARPGDELTVTGHVTDDMASICMIGPMFQATSVTAPSDR